MPAEPAHPFAGWPLQFFDPRLGFAWYCPSAALVVQTVVERGSLDAVQLLNDLIDRILRLRAQEVESAGGLLFFHDWRSLKSYDKPARALQFERMKARPVGYARRTIIVIMPANRLLRMAIETGGLFATLTFKATVELVTHPDAALGRSGITAPLQGGSFLLGEGPKD